MRNLILRKFALEYLYYSTLPVRLQHAPESSCDSPTFPPCMTPIVSGFCRIAFGPRLSNIWFVVAPNLLLS